MTGSGASAMGGLTGRRRGRSGRRDDEGAASSARCRRAGWYLVAAAASSGCGGQSVPLTYLPSDGDEGELLARAVAAAAACGSFDYFNDGDGWWAFECQRGREATSYLVVTVRDDQAMTARRDRLLQFGPVKQGPAFLVQEGRAESGVQRGLAAFPGELVRPSGRPAG